MNADPAHPEITAALVLESRAESVRMVLRPDAPCIAFADELHRAGVGVTGVLTGQSIAPFRGTRLAAKWYGETYQGTITVLEIGNEPDQAGGNDQKSPRAYLQMVQMALAGWGDRGALISTAGFSSGNPGWLTPIKSSLLRDVDIMAIHPYGQSPDGVIPAPFGNVRDLVHAYDFGVKIVASEWGISTNDEPDPDARARYISAMITALAGLGVDSQVFCLSTVMVPEWGLLAGADGLQATAAYAAFRDSFGG